MESMGRGGDLLPVKARVWQCVLCFLFQGLVLLPETGQVVLLPQWFSQ